MLRYIKHITAILLIAIFPVSAIGMDISVHNCHGKQTVRLSFLKSVRQKAKCCCCRNFGRADARNVNYCGKNLSKGSISDIKTLPCCSESSAYLSLSIESVPADNPISVIITKTLLPNEIPGFNLSSALYRRDQLKKELDYPKKEPVINIISFIHFTSSGQSEKSDLPNLFNC
jgi:hypothetical protein